MVLHHLLEGCPHDITLAYTPFGSIDDPARGRVILHDFD